MKPWFSLGVSPVPAPSPACLRPTPVVAASFPNLRFPSTPANPPSHTDHTRIKPQGQGRPHWGPLPSPLRLPARQLPLFPPEFCSLNPTRSAPAFVPAVASARDSRVLTGPFPKAYPALCSNTASQTGLRGTSLPHLSPTQLHFPSCNLFCSLTSHCSHVRFLPLPCLSHRSEHTELRPRAVTHCV